VPWYKSLRLKLALSYIALSVVPLVIFYLVAMTYIEGHYFRERFAEARSNANTVVNGVILSRGNSMEVIETNAAVLGSVRENFRGFSNDWGQRILLFDDSATALVDSNTRVGRLLPGREGQTLIIPEVLSALGRQEVFEVQREAQTFSFAMPVLYSESERVGAILIVGSAEDIFSSLAEIQNRILMYSFWVGLAVIILIFVASHWLISPLRRMLRVVQKVATGQLNQRVTIRGGDEYAVWGSAFNTMTNKLDQVEKTREEFVSNVSHELKTPLSSMKVLSESILLQESLPEEVYREFLQDIVSEVDRMTNINNDLLALVKIDQREKGLNIEPTSINRLVEDIIKRLTPLANQNEIELIYDDMRPVQIDADEIKLSLAISNIVENGIKYTPRGGTVKVIVDADHQFVFITVQDTGIGIPEDEQSQIFNRFYRVDKTRDRETGGTGLGLSISYSTVLLHNGSIRVNSKAEEGSVFIVRIPIRRSS